MPVLIIVHMVALTFFFRFEFLKDLNQQWWRSLAESTLDVALFFGLLVLGMNYLNLVNLFFKKLIREKFLLLGVLILCWPTMYKFKLIFSDTALITVGLIELAMFYAFGRQICDAVVEMFPLPEKERSKVLRRYPPQKFGDMSSFTILIVFILVMPFVIKHVIWR